jgi:hypothetical protein
MASKKKTKKGDETFTVENILKSRINQDSLKCEFKVKWVGYKEKEDQTWEKTENLDHLPLLMRNFRIRTRNALLKSAGDPKEDVAVTIPAMPKIPADIMRKLRANSDPREFFPEGTEGFARGILELISEESGRELWRVEFEKLDQPVFVRKDIAFYYWPEDAAIFASQLKEREKIIKRLLEGKDEHAAKKAKK